MQPHGELLLQILRGEIPANLTPARLDAAFDLANMHCLVGMIAEKLGARADESAGSADSTFAQWAAALDEQRVTAQVQLNAAAEIDRALRENNVAAVFVKGAALAQTVYEAPGVRQFTDLDLLINPGDLAKCDTALRKIGFALLRETMNNPIEVSYIRERLPGFKVSLDLHWDFTADDNLQAPVKIPVGEIIERARLLPTNLSPQRGEGEAGRGRTADSFAVPEIEDTLLLAAANLARKAADPLMLVVDFAKIVKHTIRWEIVRERATKWGLRTSLWLGLKLAREHLRAEILDEVLNAIAPSSARQRKLLNMLEGDKFWLANKQDHWEYRFKFKLLCLDGAAGIGSALFALPFGVLRKLAVTPTLSQRVLQGSDSDKTGVTRVQSVQ